MATQTKKAPTTKPETDPVPFTGLGLWERIDKTDPTYVKPITGKQYKGSSPNPTWLAKQLTEKLGPVGHGWGYEVLEEKILEGKPHALPTVKGGDRNEWMVWPELMHQLRIRFWTRNPHTGEIGSFEAFGGTPYRYITKGGNGVWSVDEDCAKKSLTDALTKAISMLGGAADIFLGRWDSVKYVEEMQAHFGNGADNAVQPGAPQGKGMDMPPPSNGGDNGGKPAADDPGF